MGKHGVIAFTGKLKLVDELIKSFRERAPKVMARLNKAIAARSISGVLDAYEDLIFHPSVPHEMAWGRNAGVYHGEHLVRKLWLCHYEAEEGWTWESVADIKRSGPDKCKYLESLPPEWPVARIRKTFAPVDPSRLHMWACIFGIAFKRDPKLKEACETQRITPDIFTASALACKKKLGHNPHVEDVLKELMPTLGKAV